jgi:hypothetical protein
VEVGVAGASPQKKKRPFQFSLRTLCLVVVGYTLAWGLTVAWGEPSLRAETLADLENSMGPRSTRLDFDPCSLKTDIGPYMPYHFVTTFSPCPFVVLLSSGWMRDYEIGDTKHYLCLWFLGLRVYLPVRERVY